VTEDEIRADERKRCAKVAFDQAADLKRRAKQAPLGTITTEQVINGYTMIGRLIERGPR
jgi:hypothetical protein